ncbi:MAG: META domain-containing protein [Bacteroidaceae bacterium]|nr:META domain-containing protein [Bacteroidaceae bacterium]
MSCGCKSHKDVVVNAAPEFSAEETWHLTVQKGKEFAPLEGQKEITIRINPEAGTFDGCSGCNRYFGTFKDLGKGKMILSDFNGTKMACPEAFHKVESNYMQLLHRCNGYRITAYTLELLQDDKVLLSFDKVTE